MSKGGRSYSDQSYGGNKVITIGGLAGATQTLATNGVYASHQFMFPAKLVAAKLRFGGNGIVNGPTDLTQNTEFQLFRSTDSGTGLEAVIGTADGLGATGTWVFTDPGLNGAAFDIAAAAAASVTFNTGDMIIFTAEGAWDDPVNFSVELVVFENFDTDSTIN